MIWLPTEFGKNGAKGRIWNGKGDSQFMKNYAVQLVHATVGARSDMVGSTLTSGASRVQSVRLGELAFQYGMTNTSKFPSSHNLEESSSEFYKGFLQGWFDADGSVQGNTKKGVSVRLSSSSQFALHVAQRMLARLGIIATVYKNRRERDLIV